MACPLCVLSLEAKKAFDRLGWRFMSKSLVHIDILDSLSKSKGPILLPDSKGKSDWWYQGQIY